MASETHGKKGELELLPCSFKSHNFVAQIGEVMISCQIMRMEGSLYLWIGNRNDGTMDDLSFALMSDYGKLPICTRLMGSLADVSSTNMASRLAKIIGKPVYVSFNVQADNLTLPAIEKKILQEVKNNTDLFKF